MRRTDMLAIVAAVFATSGVSVAYAADNPDIDAKAMAALQKMATYLRSFSAFRVQAVTTDEDVLDEAEVVSDRRERILYYDGKTLSVFAPRVGYYASITAPPTIAQLAKTLDNEYDLSIPLEDLFL
jgi:hypothetical protein